MMLLRNIGFGSFAVQKNFQTSVVELSTIQMTLKNLILFLLVFLHLVIISSQYLRIKSRYYCESRLAIFANQDLRFC